MGLLFRKSVKVDNDTRVNVSKRGVSVSKKIGGYTISSRGYIYKSFGNGMAYRSKKSSLISMLAILLTLFDRKGRKSSEVETAAERLNEKANDFKYKNRFNKYVIESPRLYKALKVSTVGLWVILILLLLIIT